MAPASALDGRPAVFGEVLFDRFPDGNAVLGGAPFNVAWHLQGFGDRPLFLSRVGADDAGERVRRAMQDWGMDLAGLQVDQQHPTGAVDVHFTGDQHTFKILPDQAYDHIDGDSASQALSAVTAALFCHGSLIIRTESMRSRLNRLLAEHGPRTFVDVNLREPWYRREDWQPMLDRSTWVKVNEDELKLIASHLGLPGHTLEEWSERMASSCVLDLLVVTRGGRGAHALAGDGEMATVEPDADVPVADTVGAGDAFSSVIVHGLLQGWPLRVMMERAQAFASRICQQRGATAPDSALYQSVVAGWGETA
jgi:fructokinase